MDHANYRISNSPPGSAGDHMARGCECFEPDHDHDRDERRRSDRLAGMIGLGLIVFCLGATSAIMYFREWIDK